MPTCVSILGYRAVPILGYCGVCVCSSCVCMLRNWLILIAISHGACELIKDAVREYVTYIIGGIWAVVQD